MTWIFGDGFDFYAAPADMVAGYWDSGSPTLFNIVSGRFGQGIGLISTTSPWFTKSSGANDAVHHINIAFQQIVSLTGSVLGTYLQLLDGTTAQCSIVFRSDGAIVLTSGGPGGTVLATYTGAITAQSVWTSFEIEVVINNTTGSFAVRTNGAGSNSFSATSLNTRGGTANNYANTLTLAASSNGTPLNTVNSQQIDDLLWRSDPSGVAWIGDVRAFQQMPASDVSIQFAGSPSPAVGTNGTLGSTQAFAAGTAAASLFTAAYNGTIATGTVSVSTGGTGNIKVALYSSAGAVLAASNAIVNPTAGVLTFTFPTPPTVVKGTSYYIAIDQDFSVTYNRTNASNNYSFTQAYAGFPAANPAFGSGAFGAPLITWNLTPTNSSLVNEPQEDGTTSYVFDSTVGQADFYSIAPLPVTPTSIVAVTTRGFISKSDAGTRGGQVQMKSGATTVQSPALALSTSFLWNWRTDAVNPNTSAAWTAAAVNAINIGPLVQA